MDGNTEEVPTLSHITTETRRDVHEGQQKPSVEVEELSPSLTTLGEDIIGLSIDAATEQSDVRMVEVRNSGSAMTMAAVAAQEGGGVSSSQLSENLTQTRAQIRAAFYPKFENVESDQEIKSKMITKVMNGEAILEVTLKHSGSLFMYAGSKGGAYTKNSFGNIYTAVGVFVLGRTLHEAWGTAARKKQEEFNEYLEENRICISMELVTAVLGDHGQHPKEDYVVVTAVTELGNGKPQFYSTPNVIAFCRKWRLPTNDIWLFSKSQSVLSFFDAYHKLHEEGNATKVYAELNRVADTYVPGSKNHISAQGEILEGLVARIVKSDSLERMKEVLQNFPPQPAEGAGLELGPSLRKIFADKKDEIQRIEALLSADSSFRPEGNWLEMGSDDLRNISPVSDFLQARHADVPTYKLQEMIRLLQEKCSKATAFKFYHKDDSASSDNNIYRMVVHVHKDSGFGQYRKEMSCNEELWPLYRGFFVDVNLFKASKEKASDIEMQPNVSEEEKDENLMLKLKFLNYKLRTFLMRNGVSMIFDNGVNAYQDYYKREMKKWGISEGKQKQLRGMLDEWAQKIKRLKDEQRDSITRTYLSKAEPLIQEYKGMEMSNESTSSSGQHNRMTPTPTPTHGGRYMLYTIPDTEKDFDYLFEVSLKYESLKYIGRGVNGIVCAATNAETGESVAIKKIENIFRPDKEYKLPKRTLREIRIQRQLNHQNIVAIKDIIPLSDEKNFNDVYIVLDLMDASLRDVIKRKEQPEHGKEKTEDEEAKYSNQLTNDDCRDYLYQLLRGLKYAHLNGVLHRDLKPENLLLNSSTKVLKIADLGLARIKSLKMTKDVVTLQYKAPEILLGSSTYTAAIDIWSVGCIFIEMMTGEILFPSRKQQQLKRIVELVGSPDKSSLDDFPKTKLLDYLKKLETCQRQNFADRFPSMPDDAVELLDKMLVFDPSMRISADEALRHRYFASCLGIAGETDSEMSVDINFQQNDEESLDDIKEQLRQQISNFNGNP